MKLTNLKQCLGKVIVQLIRTPDGDNWNHGVSLPIILIRIKANEMLPSSYISWLLVSIL